MAITADKILDTPLNSPEEIFSNNLVTAKKEYHALAKNWHPDLHPNDKEAEEVFAKLNGLYNKAKEMIGTDQWKRHNILKIKTGTAVREIHYLTAKDFELGRMFIGHTEILYAVDKQYEDLYDNARRFIGHFKYADAEMEKEVSRYLPKNVEYFKTADKLYMLIPKTKDVMLIEDLSNHYAGKIDSKHVAWMQSALYNITCYFDYAGIVHGDLSMRSYFVSPEFHSGLVLGGWWYATKVGEKLKALPGRSLRLCPPDVLRTKEANTRLDLELVRAMGRELLGDISGAKLKGDPRIPKPLSQWFNGATTGKARLDYQLWKDVLKLSFGAPKFIQLIIDADTIYGVRK